MQETLGLKRFVVTHVGATALALGVLVGSGLAMVGLTATGNAPWTSGNTAQNGAQQAALQSLHTAQEARFFEAKLARQDAFEVQTSVLGAAPTSPLDQLLADYARYNPEVGGARSAALEALLVAYARYNPVVDGPGSSTLGRVLAQYERYNPTNPATRQLTMERNDYYAWRRQAALSLPSPTASTTTRQWCASPRHIGFMGLRYVLCASTMGHGN
jgi:hypothetical protein